MNLELWPNLDIWLKNMVQTHAVGHGHREVSISSVSNLYRKDSTAKMSVMSPVTLLCRMFNYKQRTRWSYALSKQAQVAKHRVLENFRKYLR